LTLRAVRKQLMDSASNGQGDRPNPTLVGMTLQGITRTTTQGIALWMSRHCWPV
jgi:hypothetical protein